MIDKYFMTNDGVKIHYIEGGSGYPLVIVHGWRSEAAEYCNNLEVLAERFHVYFMEHRGHGASEKVSYGARISRLAMDLNEFINLTGHDKVNIMCHSMGCGVVWNYIDLFGQGKINKLICIDVGTFLLRNPDETQEENNMHGGMFSDLWKIYNGLLRSMDEGNIEFVRQAPDNPEDISAQSVYYRKSKELPRAVLDNKFHASLFFNTAVNDWRDVIKRIDVPMLYVVGETSRATNPMSTDWFRENVKNIEIAVFSREEYGRHSMFCSNPIKFNQEIISFLSK